MRRPLLWLTIAIAALAAGFAEVDLRLIAAAACGLAVLSGSGLLVRRPIAGPPQDSGNGEPSDGSGNGRNA